MTIDPTKTSAVVELLVYDCDNLADRHNRIQPFSQASNPPDSTDDLLERIGIVAEAMEYGTVDTQVALVALRFLHKKMESTYVGEPLGELTHAVSEALHGLGAPLHEESGPSRGPLPDSAPDPVENRKDTEDATP